MIRTITIITKKASPKVIALISRKRWHQGPPCSIDVVEVVAARDGAGSLADRLEAVIVRAVASRPERPDPVVDVPTPARSTATTPAPTSTPTPTTSTSPSPEAAPPTSGGSGPADVGPAPQD